MEIEQQQITASNAIRIIDSILSPPEPLEVEKLIKKLKDAEAINDSEYKKSEEGEQVYIDIYNKGNYPEENFQDMLSAFKALTNCFHLTLDFTNCLFGARIVSVFQSVSTMTNLKYFQADLNQNQIDQNIAKEIADSLKKNVNLENLKLIMKHNQIGEAGLVYLSEALSSLKKLKSIEIKVYENNVQNGVSHLIKQIGTINTLREVVLFFSKNDISDKQAVEIGHALSSLKGVTSLFIHGGWNKIESDGLISIAQGITKMPNLKKLHLYFSSNQIKAKGFLQLLQEINKCTELTFLEINLSGNQLNTFDVEDIKKDFIEAIYQFNTKLINLKHLILYLRKNDLKSSLNPVFSILRQNKNLHHLILDYSFNNQILTDRQKVSFLMKKIPRLTTVIVHLDPNN